MSWKPINDKRAIDRVRFVIVFKETLTQKTFDELADSFKANFSKDYSVKDMPYDNGDDNNGIALTFQKTVDSDENKVLENLIISRNGVAFEVVNYTEWKPFDEIINKITKLATDITVKAVDIHQLSLECWHKFIFEGEIENADPRLLLKDLRPNIPETVLANGESWDLSKSWFQAVGNTSEKVLVKLNYQGQDATNVETKIRHKMTEIHTITVFKKIYSEKNIDSLVKDTQKLHKVSKDLFSNSLVDAMKKSVKF